MTVSARTSPRFIYLAVALAVCLVLCVALSICFFASPRPAPITRPAVAVTDTAAQSGEDKIYALADAPLGAWTMELSEEELSSLLALRLPGSPFLEPQVHITTDRLYISGIVNMGVPLKVVSSWRTEMVNNRPRIKLERAALGPFALAPFLLNSVSATINEMIDESGTGIMPTRVQLSDGRIVIDGTKDTATIP